MVPVLPGLDMADSDTRISAHIDPARAVSGQWHRKRCAVYYKVCMHVSKIAQAGSIAMPLVRRRAVSALRRVVGTPLVPTILCGRPFRSTGIRSLPHLPSSLSELSSRPVGWAMSLWRARGRVRRSISRRAQFGA